MSTSSARRPAAAEPAIPERTERRSDVAPAGSYAEPEEGLQELGLLAASLGCYDELLELSRSGDLEPEDMEAVLEAWGIPPKT